MAAPVRHDRAGCAPARRGRVARWADVDAAGLRLRLPRSATKRDRARWVYLPEWLMQAIEETCPLEDRVPERKVFQGITEASAYQAMSRACKNAKVPHYHPHDLRHRRITIWHQSGVPARELAERAGHSRPSMSLDVYSHVPADCRRGRLRGGNAVTPRTLRDDDLRQRPRRRSSLADGEPLAQA